MRHPEGMRIGVDVPGHVSDEIVLLRKSRVVFESNYEVIKLFSAFALFEWKVEHASSNFGFRVIYPRHIV